MDKIVINIERNYMIYPLTGKIMLDGIFFDYIKASDNKKVIEVSDTAKNLTVKFGIWESNTLKLSTLSKERKEINISSKIQNGFFLFSYGLFFLSIAYAIFANDSRYYNSYMRIAMLIPFAILAYKQTFQRKGLITIEKKTL